MLASKPKRLILPILAILSILSGCSSGGGSSTSSDTTGNSNPVTTEPKALRIIDADDKENAVAFNAAKDTPVGVTSSVESATQVSNVEFTLLDTADNQFKIDSSTGIIRVDSLKTQGNHDVVVQARTMEAVGQQTFTINVTPSGPDAHIIFPPARALYNDDRISVRGTYTPGQDVEITVSGGAEFSQAILESTNGTWHLEDLELVPDETGTSYIQVIVEAKDTGLQTSLFSRLNSNPVPNYPIAMAKDVESGVYYIADRYRQTITRLKDQKVTIVASATKGLGTDLGTMNDLELDKANNRLLVVQHGVRILAVDLDSGDRSVVSDNQFEGPDFLDLTSIELDSENNVAYVADSRLDTIFSIDLTTGTRSIVASNDVGAGVELEGILDFKLDKANNRLIAADYDSNRIAIIDIQSGDRYVLSENGDGRGPAFRGESHLAGTLENNVIYTKSFYGAITEVALDTGERRRIVNERELFEIFGDILHDSEKNEIVVLDPKTFNITAVHVNTKVSRLIHNLFPEFELASGESLANIGQIKISEDENTVLISSFDDDRFRANDRLITLSADNGERTKLPISIANYTDIDFSNNSTELFASTFSEITKINLSSGESEIVADVTTIGLPDVDSFNNNFATLSNNDLVLAYPKLNGLVRIDAKNGVGEILTSSKQGNEVGAGPSIPSPRGIIANNDESLLFVLDHSLESVFSVDLTTGNRTLLSGPGGGNAVSLEKPSFISKGPGDKIYVMNVPDDRMQVSLIEIDTVTGDTKMISNNLLHEGTQITYPFDMDIVKSKNLMLVNEFHSHAVFMIDLLSGQRVLYSR